MLRACALLLWFNIIIGITNGFSAPEKPYTCVIGGGYSGLAISKYLKSVGLNFTVFERTKYVGGTWRFDPHVGVDEDGVPVSTSQYKYLRTNSPRQSMEYKDFPFPEPAPSFPLGTCVYKYILSFVKHYDLMTNIQLRSYVQSVKRVNDQWKLSYYKTDNKENHTVLCDYVIVAIGQYVKPYTPEFAGLEKFKGKVIHCHDYKSPEEYKDRKVLLVGSGPSGLDLAPQLHKITEKLVHSHHLIYSEPKFSEKYVKKPDIKEFVHNGVIFNDMSFEEVDDVIFATGYRLEHPFLDESSGLTLTPNFVLPLYKQIVNIRHPSMLFIGLVKHFMNRIIDIQAEYISLLISGKFKLPSKEKMLEEWATKYSSRKLKDIHDIRAEVKQYVQSLSEEAGASKVPQVLIDVIFKSIDNAYANIFNYRDYKFEIMDDYNFRAEVIHNNTEEMKKPKTPYACIIGGGYSGLAISRYLKKFGINFTVFERTRYVGGTWRFDSNVGVDENGVPVSTSQYKYLRTSTPRQSMEYKDFPFSEPTPLFPSGTFFYKYIMSFVKHFDLTNNIQLRSYVQSVKRVNDQWELSYYKTDNKENHTVLCDFVVIANGHYIKPHALKFVGLEHFQGSGPSGLDLASQLHNITKKLVHSHHLTYNEPNFSKKYIKKPHIKEFVYNEVIFNDSSFEEIEDVLLATGYRFEHPFLDHSSGLILNPNFVLPLHKQIVNIRHPSMLFLGIVKHFMNRIIDAQAEYISFLISGKFDLHSTKKMLDEWATKYSTRKLKDIHDKKW